LRQNSSQFYTGQDPPGHDEIGGQHPLKMFGRFKFSLLDATAALKGTMPFFDAPAAAIPLHFFPSLFSGRSGTVCPSRNSIHSAKGREFDFVFLIGLAEDMLPSFQSIQKGDKSPEMEEERRNCFVALTRTKECLVLSRAKRYRGYLKQPSRFLKEMGFAGD